MKGAAGDSLGPDWPPLGALWEVAEVIASAHRAGRPCCDRCPRDATCVLVQRVEGWTRLAADIVVDSHAAGAPCSRGCAGGDDCARLADALAVLVAEGEMHLLE